MSPARATFTVNFEKVPTSLASPQVFFIGNCAITDFTEQSVKGYQSMNNITDRALEKLIENFHIPSSAAGNPEHMSFVMGDWNVTRKDFEKSSEDSIVHRSVFKPSR